MRGFIIEEVNGKKGKKAFADVAREIYRDDAEWICPLDKHIENIFNPSNNPCFQNGEACRWILRDNKGNLIGRIAAFINGKKNKSLPFPVGGIGFFECVDNINASKLLFDTAKSWLQERKMEAIDGPINFGENDRYWGLLVEGFTSTPFTTNYNKPYYRKLFEEYGFKVYYEMFSNEIDLSKQMDSRFFKIASWIGSKNEITFRHANKNNLVEFGEHFREIYNDAWQFHDGYSPITEVQTKKFASEMKHVIVDNFCPFAFVKGEPAGFIIATPDLNQLLKPFKGRPPLFQMLLLKWRSRNNFSWYRKRGLLTRGHAIAIGIKPKFQQYGIETGMMMNSIESVRALGFKTIELRWAGDFNPKVIRLHKAVGAYPVRKHVTFRLMLSEGRSVTGPEKISLGRKR